MPEFPTLRDIAERPEPFDALPWLLAGVGVVLVLAVLAFVFYPHWRRQRQKPDMPPVVDPKSVALNELKQLAEPDADQVPQRVQKIIRTYLHRKHGALGLYRTADELLGKDAPGAPPLPPGLAPFAPVLREAEELRYGRTDDDAKTLIATAIAALETDASPNIEEKSRAVQ